MNYAILIGIICEMIGLLLVLEPFIINDNEYSRLLQFTGVSMLVLGMSITLFGLRENNEIITGKENIIAD